MTSDTFSSTDTHDFEAIKARLEQIVEEVNAEGISLDEALALYEEAVSLGLAACDVTEEELGGIETDS